MGWLKIQKLEYLENETWLFCEIKKFLSCASDDKFWEVFIFCQYPTVLAVEMETAETNVNIDTKMIKKKITHRNIVQCNCHIEISPNERIVSKKLMLSNFLLIECYFNEGSYFEETFPLLISWMQGAFW